jgi:acetyltransferase-like isoleucine patch superfamily enzyme
MRIGRGTMLPKPAATWPNQVTIGIKSRIEEGVYFRCDTFALARSTIVIGDDSFIEFGCDFNVTSQIKTGDQCVIACGAELVDHKHGTELSILIAMQERTGTPI